MMKTICITGKHNIDEMYILTADGRDRISDDCHGKRVHLIDISDDELTSANQKIMINKIYSGEDFPLKIILVREINNKLNGYKIQDIKRTLYDKDEFIKFADIIELLVSSDLICCYCKKEILLLYKNVRDKFQWKLDRIDNSIGHIKPNVVISCLKCNLSRGVINHKKFVFTKDLNIVKCI